MGGTGGSGGSGGSGGDSYAGGLVGYTTGIISDHSYSKTTLIITGGAGSDGANGQDGVAG